MKGKLNRLVAKSKNSYTLGEALERKRLIFCSRLASDQELSMCLLRGSRVRSYDDAIPSNGIGAVLGGSLVALSLEARAHGPTGSGLDGLEADLTLS